MRLRNLNHIQHSIIIRNIALRQRLILKVIIWDERGYRKKEIRSYGNDVEQRSRKCRRKWNGHKKNSSMSVSFYDSLFFFFLRDEKRSCWSVESCIGATTASIQRGTMNGNNL